MRQKPEHTGPSKILATCSPTIFYNIYLVSKLSFDLDLLNEKRSHLEHSGHCHWLNVRNS